MTNAAPVKMMAEFDIIKIKNLQWGVEMLTFSPLIHPNYNIFIFYT